MFKVLLLVALTMPLPAQAGFIVAGVTAAFSVIGGWLTAGGIVGFVSNTALALLSTAIQTSLGRRKAKQQDVYRELSQPESLPQYRFVYGKCWAPGTPAPVRVKGSKIYGCWILNSRESVGPFTLYLDKRQVVATGNPYDFSNLEGARATNAPFGEEDVLVRYWIGRGGQTSPPQRILNEAPELFRPTDGWRGITVLWAIISFGSKEGSVERWPSAPPEVIVDGQWSKVWNPGVPSQLPNDPSTWSYSRNQSLIVLDALRNNPVRPYPLDHLWIETFSWAAAVANTPLPTKDGTNPPRFRCDGVLVFSPDVEVEDLVSPLMAAGASRWLRGRGQLGILPATYSDPVGEITEVMSDQDMVFERWRASDELYTEAYATYTSPKRAYETATTPVFKAPGAEAQDGTGPRPMSIDLDFVLDHRQAQYVSKIELMRTRMQRSMEFMAPPESLNYIAGATLTVNLPAPYNSRNTTYTIEEMSPALDPMGGEGVSFRIPMKIRQTSQAVFSWNPATEEKDVEEEELNPIIEPLPQVASISLVSGATVSVNSGNSSLPRVKFEFSPVDDDRVTGYEWQIRRKISPGGPGQWNAGGTIDSDVLNPGGNVEGFSGVLSQGLFIAIRVRALSTNGSVSKWSYSSEVTASVGSSLVSPPLAISAEAVASGIRVTYRVPNENGFGSMEIYAANTNNVSNSSLLFGPISASKNEQVVRTEGSLSNGQTRYYWARSIDYRGIASSFSPVMSATYTEA